MPERTITAWRAAASIAFEIIAGEAGRADDMGDPRLRRERRQFDARRGRREIDNAVGRDDACERIAA